MTSSRQKDGWGGRRANQTGRPVGVPVGEGERRKITVPLGAELDDLLRARHPDWSDQDLVRAVLWAAVGRPVGPPEAGLP